MNIYKHFANIFRIILNILDAIPEIYSGDDEEQSKQAIEKNATLTCDEGRWLTRTIRTEAYKLLTWAKLENNLRYFSYFFMLYDGVFTLF